MFSTKFEKCMCLKCAMERHDLLSDFMPIAEAAELMKATGNALLDETLQIDETLRKIKRDKVKFLEKLHSSEKDIRAQVRKIKDGIMRHLDVLEQRVSTALKQIVGKHEVQFQKDQHELSIAERDLKRVKDNVANALQMNSESEMIECIAKERMIVHQKKNVVKTHQSRKSSKFLQFQMAQSVLDFTQTVNELGEVSMKSLFDDSNDIEPEEFSPEPPSFRSLAVPLKSTPFATSTPLPVGVHISPRSTSRSVGYPRTKSRNKYGMHAANPYHSHVNVRDIESRAGGTSHRQFEGDGKETSFEEIDDNGDPIVMTAKHNGPCNLSGLASLSGGRTVVCDSKHKSLQLVSRKSEVLDELVFHFKPCNVATVSDNDFVVSFMEKDFISIYTTTATSLRHKRNLGISGRGGSYSVAYSGNKFAVCRRGEIKVVAEKDGELINTIQIEAHFPQIAMSDAGTRIYLSDFVGGRITCMNEIGKVRWEYSHDDLEPSGIAVDLNQLFVTDVKGSILVMSTYGIVVRKLQCPGHLNALCVDSHSVSLLVSQEENRDKEKSRVIKILAL